MILSCPPTLDSSVDWSKLVLQKDIDALLTERPYKLTVFDQLPQYSINLLSFHPYTIIRFFLSVKTSERKYNLHLFDTFLLYELIVVLQAMQCFIDKIY